MKVCDQPITFMETRLIWMKENHPEYLLELYQEKELGRYLHRKIQNAIDMEKFLEDQGNLDEFQIEEVILEMLAPAEDLDLDDDKVDMISEKQFNQIGRDTFKVYNKAESKKKPTFKKATPEENQAHRERMAEAIKKASENLKYGIYPQSKMQIMQNLKNRKN